MLYVIQITITACEQDQDGTSSSCSQAVSKPVWHILLLCVQWKRPDDGQRNCPKHVALNSKNKFEKLVHLVGFIIRIHIYISISARAVCTAVKENIWLFFPDSSYLIRLQCGRIWWHDIYHEVNGRLFAFWSTLWVPAATASLVRPFNSWWSSFLTCQTGLFTYPHRYKSSGVKSLDLGDQAIGTALPIHQPGVCD